MSFISWLMGSITLQLQGMNVEKFLAILSKNNIFVKDIVRVSYNNFYLKTNCFYYKKLLEQADKLCYNVSVKKSTGLYAIYCFFKHRLALFIMLVLGVIFTIASCFFVWQIKVSGNDNITYEQISLVLRQNNICVGQQKSNINVDTVEQLLYDNFDNISLVSATMYGSTLVVNIKEKLYVPEMQAEFKPLVATKGGIIKEITLISGTLNCKVGDTVKQGDILVYPYTIDASGEQKPIIALADVTAYVDVEGRVEYNENQIKYTRTGKSITCRFYNLLGLNINLDKKVNKFVNYDTSVKEYYAFNNNLLPIKVKKVTYYETVGQEVRVDFDQVKQQQIQLSQDLAYQSLPEGLEVLSEQTLISNNQNIYYVITYLKTIQTIV